jgi:hypothetical protein
MQDAPEAPVNSQVVSSTLFQAVARPGWSLRAVSQRRRAS